MLSVKNGDVVTIRRSDVTEVVIITTVEVRNKNPDDDVISCFISFRAAKPGETTTVSVGLFLFREWIQNAEVPPLTFCGMKKVH